MAGIADLALGAAPTSAAHCSARWRACLGGPDFRAIIKSDVELLKSLPEDSVEVRKELKRTIDERTTELDASIDRNRELRMTATSCQAATGGPSWCSSARGCSRWCGERPAYPIQLDDHLRRARRRLGDHRPLRRARCRPRHPAVLQPGLGCTFGAQVCAEELLHRLPVLLRRRFVVGSVVGDGEAVRPRIPLHDVFDAGVGQRQVQALLILDGVGRVVRGAADVDRRPDAVGEQVWAASPTGRRRRGRTSPRPPVPAPGRPRSATSVRPCSNRSSRTAHRAPPDGPPDSRRTPGVGLHHLRGDALRISPNSRLRSPSSPNAVFMSKGAQDPLR